MVPKSARHLHILNGDATQPEFDKSRIPGDVIIWREILVEGPVTGDIASSLFWKRRKAYVETTFEGSGDYDELFMPQLERLDQIAAYDQVTLWFEYDLFCQVNMLGCLARISHPHISLVCLGDEVGGQWKGLGQIVASDMVTLYAQRRLLQAQDHAYARSGWEAYVGTDLDDIKSFRKPHDTFTHLDRALQAHLSRFPGRNGLNAIEHDALEIVQEGITDEKQLIRQLLYNQHWLGFGDLQYYHLLQTLQPLIAQDLTLTEKGEAVIDHRDFFEQPNESLGGIYRPDYYHQTYS